MSGAGLLKVQCKWGRLSPTGDVVIAPVLSCRRTGSGFLRKRYSQDEVDLIAVYCGELNRSFLIRVSTTAGMSAIQLRLTPPKNGQRACINLADDFDFVGAIAQLGERRHGMAEVVGSSPTSSTSVSPSPTTVGSNPFRDGLGYWMERAAGGEEILVTFRGKPRIRLAPARPGPVPQTWEEAHG
jgi:hypothetical protein